MMDEYGDEKHGSWTVVIVLAVLAVLVLLAYGVTGNVARSREAQATAAQSQALATIAHEQAGVDKAQAFYATLTALTAMVATSNALPMMCWGGVALVAVVLWYAGRKRGA